MMTEDSHSQYEEQIAKSEVPVKTFVVSVAEKISRDYEVIGAKSMAEAIRLVKENGGHFYHDEDRQSTEIDGTWDFHHEFTPKAVESLTSSPCVMISSPSLKCILVSTRARSSRSAIPRPSNTGISSSKL